MALADLAPYSPDVPPKAPPTAPTEKIKVFIIPAEKLKQLVAFREKHNKECKYPRRRPDISSCDTYMYTFRPSGLGDNIHIVCDCGEKFHPDAGNDMI